ncbi:hypothetical protein GOBAR_AA34456 [Gossypium barbadense]|uniref:Uncharacterized protein n=1 Tax=Gossypium barbadense TaxID=3634 RepID=A0A2P5W573_GOSBA|nr:hypothetical protein GOBAR_AA34456 [Gossypium barbadense]
MSMIVVKKVAVVTDKAPATLGSHSQVVVLDVWLISKVLIMSVGFYSKPEVHLDQIEDQTEQVLKNMGEILKAGVANYSAVVKTTIILSFTGSSSFNVSGSSITIGCQG